MNLLREYQKQAINNIRNHFVKGKKKILLVAPTGSGKTVIASSMLEQIIERGNFGLFVAHRRELVMQCSRKLSDFDIKHGVIMASKTPNHYADVQIASIQTFTSRKDRDDFIKPNANVIIIDEAHRSTSKSFKKLIEEYPDAYVIGLTATPCRADGKGLGNIYQELVQAGNIKDLTRQEFYQHHVDQELKARGWKSKLVVPEDFKSSVKQDTAYDLSLKRQIEHVRTINGFWKTLTTEAEGTRPKGPEDDRINFSVKAGLMEAIEKNTSTVETGRTTVNTNNTLTFESPFAADSLSYFGKQGLNMIEVQTLPNYYGDTIRAAGSAQDWLFNSGQTDWYFIPGEVPGLPGSWRYRD